QRFLADEPVSVYREPLSARLARWRRRHRTAASGIGALLLAAVVGLSIGTVLINRERARAEASFRQAREAVDELFTITAARSPRVCSHSATGKRRWGVRTRPGQGTSRRSRSPRAGRREPGRDRLPVPACGDLPVPGPPEARPGPSRRGRGFLPSRTRDPTGAHPRPSRSRRLALRAGLHLSGP